MKAQKLDEYRAQKRGGRGKQAASTKEDDFVDNLFIANTHDYILCFSSRGQVYWIKVYDVPQGSRTSRGKPIVNLLPLEDGEKITLDSLELEIIHTPGHTPGGISIKLDGVVFTGDTLFAGSIGRTDLPAGDQEEIFRSIREKLFVLGDDVIVYPGHGTASTIGEEKRSNPFFI